MVKRTSRRMTVMDQWGGAIASAAVALLAGAQVAQADPEVVMSKRWVKAARAEARERYAKRENLVSIQKQLVAFARARGLGGILKPWEVTPGSLDDVNSAVESLADLLDSDKLDSAPSGVSETAAALAVLNHDCEDEIGAENLLDQQYDDSYGWYQKGIMRNVEFPLREHMTCVRSQGQRGLCTVFAATAAIETLYHQEYGEFANFSEQAAYLWAYANVDPDGSEGLPTEKAVKAMADEGYRFALERDWQYNPSLHRDEDDERNAYEDVCLGYTTSSRDIPALGGEYCTETIHQGIQRRISDSYSSWGMDYTLTYTEYSAPSTVTPTRYGFENSHQLWSDESPDASLSLMRGYLAAGIPLVFGGGVTPMFKANDQRGYVPYIRSEPIVGGHAMLIIGWVPNSSLPEGAPSGSGGGYFVLKNSWGMSRNNDRGYYYLPVDYMKEHTAGVTAVFGNF